MTIDTYTLSVTAIDASGNVLPDARVVATLDKADLTADGVLLPSRIEAQADGDGLAELELASNLDGTQNSRYRIEIFRQTGKLSRVFDRVQMPRANTTLQQIIEAPEQVVSLSGAAISADIALNAASAAEGARDDILTDAGFIAVATDLQGANTIGTVAGIATEVAAVGGITSEVEAVAGITAEVEAVAGITSEVVTVSQNVSNIGTVAGIDSDVTAVAGVAAEVGAIGGLGSEITTLASISSDITATAAIASDVTVVAGIDGQVVAVAGIASNVTDVAGIVSDVTAVSGVASEVQTLGALGSEITTLAGISSDITNTAAISSDVTAVANIAGDVTIAADNISAILAAPQAATDAEAARDKAQEWAESEGQEPGGPGTKSAKEWAGEAEQSADDAAGTVGDAIDLHKAEDVHDQPQNADRLQGRSVGDADPDDGDVLVWDDGEQEWVPSPRSSSEQFTPLLIGKDVTGDNSYELQRGISSAVGDQVTIAIEVKLDGTTGALESEGELEVLGVPMPVSDESPDVPLAVALRAGGDLPANRYLAATLISDTRRIRLMEMTTSAGEEPLVHGDVDDDLHISLAGSYIGRPFEVKDIFDLGEAGFYLRTSSDTLFTDAAGTTPAAPSDTAAKWQDESGNDTAVEQDTAGERPEYQDDPDRLLIASGKRLQADIPAIQGTMIIATDDGTAAYGVDISSGNYPVGRNAGNYFPGGELMGQVLIDRDLSAVEINAVRQFYIARGAGDDYGSVMVFQDYWRDRSEITEFPLIDTSAGANFRDAWRGCSSLPSFPELDVSNGTNFISAWNGCSSLATFPELDVASGQNFGGAWRGCSSLSSFPELDVSNGINFTDAWRDCSALTDFPELQFTSGTTFRDAWRDCSALTSFPALDLSNGSNFREAWSGCSSLTSFPGVDVSGGTSFFGTWRGCSALTSFPALDLSNGTTFFVAWQNCSSLAGFPAQMFDDVSATDFSDAFAGTNLNQASIDNILVSINAANTSNGTFSQSGGSAPSEAGEAAIDALVGRGWTVSVTGGYTP